MHNHSTFWSLIWARQRPTRLNGGNAYPFIRDQFCVNASVASASGSGLQLTNRGSWFVSRVAKRSTSNGPDLVSSRTCPCLPWTLRPLRHCARLECVGQKDESVSVGTTAKFRTQGLRGLGMDPPFCLHKLLQLYCPLAVLLGWRLCFCRDTLLRSLQPSARGNLCGAVALGETTAPPVRIPLRSQISIIRLSGFFRRDLPFHADR
jgi:hypothetical protein